MKNFLTQWVLRRKTNLKLEPRGLALLGFIAEAVKWPAALSFSATGPSRRSSSYRGLGPSEFKLLGASHCRCNVNKRQGRFGKKKNDSLVDKKSPNPVEIEEENQDRKDLVVVQSFKIDFCDQWCIELDDRTGHQSHRLLTIQVIDHTGYLPHWLLTIPIINHIGN